MEVHSPFFPIAAGVVQRFLILELLPDEFTNTFFAELSFRRELDEVSRGGELSLAACDALGTHERVLVNRFPPSRFNVAM